MSILPAGRLTVHAHDTGAVTADHLLGRPHIPAIASALMTAEATVRGLVTDPLHAGRARDSLLSKWDRAIDVDIDGGARLRAIDAADGNFHVHVTPPIGSKDYSINIGLAPEGRERDAIVRTNPHSPDAPVGFYNLEQSTGAVDLVTRVLTSAAKAEDTSRVNRMRANGILSRLGKVKAYLQNLGAAAKAHPELALLPEAARLAHDSKKPGDALDQKLSATVAKVEAFLAGDGQALSPPLRAQVKEDLATIAADRKKWHGWRASTGIFTYYVER